MYMKAGHIHAIAVGPEIRPDGKFIGGYVCIYT